MIQFSVSETYQTSEEIVGKWIDGKNIYRKVLPVPAGPTTALPLLVPMGVLTLTSGIDTMVRVWGVLKEHPQFGPWFVFPNGTPLQGGILLEIDNSNILVATGNGADYSTYSGFIVIEYTKQTF